MPNTVIKIEDLGKLYMVGHKGVQSERYTRLSEVIYRNAKNIVRKTCDMLQGKAIIEGDEVEAFWALKDINVEIKQGERIGIIGGNGAGKSTLLKILSRITEPTKGRVVINGRVASLLEVGTGFHPELTGRDNIFLNGAILGMGQKEIRRKFDEIVDFSEVGKFLDTPVKRYSSGMYVRLAFAVAAHLEPEILVIDEVLAVGDAKFQKKCLGKIEDMSGKEGRTVIFVSHNMAAIQSVCQKSILLKNGQVNFLGSSDEAVQHFLSATTMVAKFDRPASGMTSITGGCVKLENDMLIIDVQVTSERVLTSSLEITLHDNLGMSVGFSSIGLLDTSNQIQIQKGISRFTCRLLVSSLAEGSYSISIVLGIPWIDIIDKVDHIIGFDFTRPATAGMQHVLKQQWGRGCFEVPMTVTLSS